jgi:glycosyltransferase involved in cell wall biosynthesis
MLDFFRRAPGLPAVEWHLLPPGIHRPERWREAAVEAPAGPPWKVGCWGGICRDKGLDLAVKALARPAFRGQVELHLRGEIIEEDYAAELRREAAGAGLPLHLHGPVPAAALPGRVADLACALFPSRCFESYGLVVDEAMLLGLPVVAAETGALAERLGPGGLTFPRGDAGALAERLAEVLADPPAWRRRARGQGVPDFEEHVRAVEGLYG